jgi:FKBP-type peptidyl-prolyl cis-trans isomerase FkpA
MKKQMNRILAGCMLIIVMASGCLKDQPDGNCTFDPCAFVVPAAETAMVEEYLNANSITATKHCSGMYYTIINQGTGASPEVCDGVSVKYVGKLTNGSTFDQAANPVNFNLSTLIGGWQLGIPLIKTGGKIMLYLPPSLGYGSAGSGSIPANSVLIFDIDLVDVY